MDYIELEKKWKDYDVKLNRLESLNKKLILESLTKKSQKRINWQKIKGYYGLIIVPLALVVALHPMYNSNSLNDSKFIAGALLLLLLIGYTIIFHIQLIRALKKIDLINDTVVKSARLINSYKKMIVSRFKLIYLTMPISLLGVVLIGWDRFSFDFSFYLLCGGIFLFAVLFGRYRLQNFKKKMDNLANDITELKDYKE